MRNYKLFSPLLLVTACSGSPTVMNEASKTAEAPQIVEESSLNNSPPEPLAPVPPETPSASLPTASIPISIGGASLTCSLLPSSDSEVSCLAYHKDGTLMSDSPKDLYISRRGTAAWSAIVFGFDETKKTISFTLPSPLLNDVYRVAATTSEDETIPGWIVNPSVPPQNIVSDGSFEQHTIDLTDELGSQFVSPDEQTFWKAKSMTGGACLNLYEVRSQLQNVPSTPLHGDQVVELDSNCDGMSFNGGNNIDLYQDVSTKIDSYYLVSFHYQRRGLNPKVQALKASFGSQVLLEKTVTEQNWIEVKTIVKATAVATRISFKETGDSSDGVGTQIDSVSIYELGDLPSISP